MLFTHKLLREILTFLRHQQEHRNHQHKELMAAIDSLNTSLTTLATAVDSAVAVLTAPAPTGGATEAQVQAVADTVNAQSARLVAAVTPPTPAS